MSGTRHSEYGFADEERHATRSFVALESDIAAAVREQFDDPDLDYRLGRLFDDGRMPAEPDGWENAKLPSTNARWAMVVARSRYLRVSQINGTPPSCIHGHPSNQFRFTAYGRYCRDCHALDARRRAAR